MNPPHSYIPLTKERWEAFLNSQSLFEESPVPGIELFKMPQPSKGIPEGLQLSPRPQGKQMEAIMKAVIETGDHYDLLAHGMQIESEGRTIGELDFLLKDRSTGRIIHVEMVYKYYIFDRNEPEREGHWIGPARKDRMNWKLQHLEDRQFPLLRHPATIEKLGELDVELSQVDQKLCFLGELFLPLNHKEDRLVDRVRPQSIAGRWMNRAAWNDMDKDELEIFIPPKSDWLLPLNQDLLIPWSQNNDLEKHFESARVPLVWLRKEGELLKTFITLA